MIKVSLMNKNLNKKYTVTDMLDPSFLNRRNIKDKTKLCYWFLSEN